MWRKNQKLDTKEMHNGKNNKWRQAYVQANEYITSTLYSLELSIKILVSIALINTNKRNACNSKLKFERCKLHLLHLCSLSSMQNAFEVHVLSVVPIHW